MFNAGEFVEVTLMPDQLRMAGTIRQTDGEHLLVAVEAADAPHIEVGALVQLVQSVKTGLYQIETTVLNRRNNLFVVKSGRPRLLQRRRSQRIPCDLPARYSREWTLEKIPEMYEDEGTMARIVDLSLGGAQMMNEALLCAGFKIVLEITMDEVTEETISAEASVVRCTLRDAKEAQNSSMRYRVAVQFTRMSRIHQVQLQRFLMRQTGLMKQSA